MAEVIKYEYYKARIKSKADKAFDLINISDNENTKYNLHDYSKDYLTFNMLESGRIYFEFYNTDQNNIIYYSINNGSWIEYIHLSGIQVNIGDKIRFKCNTNNIQGIYDNLVSYVKYTVYGNILSLIYGDDFVNYSNQLDNIQTCLMNVFEKQKGLISAKHLILPLTTMPTYGYSGMFTKCESLKYPPKLPATTLAQFCYSNMFQECTSLVNAPELSATTLAKSCYYSMFEDCHSLKQAPVLRAPILVNSCYGNMFCGCTNLEYIKMLATDVSAFGCLNNWVLSITHSGVFVKHPDATIPYNDSGIPTGWTVQEARY